MQSTYQQIAGQTGGGVVNSMLCGFMDRQANGGRDRMLRDTGNEPVALQGEGDVLDRSLLQDFLPKDEKFQVVQSSL